MKKLRLLACLSFACLFLLGMTVTSYAGSRVYLAPSEINSGAVGSTLTAEVKIDGASDLVAWEVRITVDPHVVRIVDFVEGGFLKGNGGSTVAVGPIIDGTGGKVVYAVAQTGTERSATGSGTLGRLDLRVANEGISSIALSAELVDSGGAESNAETTTGRVSISTAVSALLTSSGGDASGGGGSQQQTPLVSRQVREVAQEGQLGEIRGRAVNQAGQAIQSASVRINQTTVKTDSDGRFAFSLVRPGVYTIHYKARRRVSQTQELTVSGGAIVSAPTVVMKSVKRISSSRISKNSSRKGKNLRKRSRILWWK